MAQAQWTDELAITSELSSCKNKALTETQAEGGATSGQDGRSQGPAP
jgi:hypothetical protein